jgi:hypothetical protein
MIQIVAEKARAAGIGSIRLLTGPATTCSAVQRPIPSPVKWRTGRKWLAAQQVVPDL